MRLAGWTVFARQLHFIASSKRFTSAGSRQSNTQSDQRWDIYASVCLERKPQITKEMTPLEKKYAAFLAEYEGENSFKSDHEMRHLSDIRLAEKIKSGEVDSGTIQTAEDFEDKSNAELLTFVPMSRKTEADEKSDLKSLKRALDSHLLLVVAQQLGNNDKWICPQIKLEQNQTLRQAANTILQAVCPSITTKVLGNAPFGYYQYNYPRGTKNDTGEDVTGAKVFFLKANYITGEMVSSPAPTIKDFLWLKRDELKSKLQKKYHHQISQFLIPEGENYVQPGIQRERGESKSQENKHKI